MKKTNFKLKKNKFIFLGVTIAIFVMITLLIQYIRRTKENATFYIPKIILYHSASITNSSGSSSLSNLDIHQYSDFSIYIDNNMVDSKLTDANTIKELYIDNISISTNSDRGTKMLYYKNPMTFGKYTDLTVDGDDGRIDFKVVSTNRQNEEANYDEPVFYTDCSNPITLGFVNKEIVTKYSSSDGSNKVYYNAKVLKEADIPLDDINPTIHFTIHIVNNLNHHLSCDIRILKPLDEDFLNTGYSYMVNNLPNNKYKFKRD